MKAEWHKQQLAAVAEKITDGSHNPPKGVPASNYLMLSSKNVFNDHLHYAEPRYLTVEQFQQEDKRTGIVPGDVLLTIVGTVGRSAVVPNNAPRITLQRSVAVIRPKRKIIEPRFLMYSFIERTAELNEKARGVAQKGVYLETLRELGLMLPPLDVQRRIVGILDEAFAGIATAKANAEKNLQNAHAIFESHLNAVFTQKGKGWVEKKLGDVCEITSTLVDPRKKEFLELIHVGAGNIESRTGVFVDLKTVREEYLISGKFLFDNSMVLYSKIRPYLMKVARPRFDGVCSADMYPLTPLPNEINRDYLFHLLLSKSFTDYAIQGSARAGMPKVNREHLFEFKIWLPVTKIQKVLAAKLDDLHKETRRLESIYQQKLAALDELKKSLLYDAFRGEL